MTSHDDMHADAIRAEITEQAIDRSPMELADVRAVVQLIGDIAALDAPLADRRRELMDRLTELVNATGWMWTTSTGFRPGQTPMTVGWLYGGFTERQAGMIMEASQDTEYPMPENPPMIESLKDWKHVTRSRRDFIGDDAFYRHPQWELYRKPCGSDHYLFSLYPINKDYLSGIGIHRQPGEPDFTTRERRIVHVVTSEVRWLHRSDLPEDLREDPLDLTPRSRVVLGQMLQGWNRKQIAASLGISPTTTAGYQKQIYRHFNVSSQAQLLARFIAGDGGDAAAKPDT